MDQSIWVVHPTGNPNSKALCRGLFTAGLLGRLFTSIAVPEAFGKCGGILERLANELGRRIFPGIPYQKIRTFPMREIVRIAAPYVGISAAIQSETGWACIDEIGRTVSKGAALALLSQSHRPSAVYAYEDSACEVFRAAERVGVRRIYELPVAVWRERYALYREEALLEPAWADTIEALSDSPAKLARKDEEICRTNCFFVPCSYVARSLRTHYDLSCPVFVCPYGAPTPVPGEPSRRELGAPLRVAFAGHIRQHKGVSYLLKAVSLLGRHAELTLIGSRAKSYSAEAERSLAEHRLTGPLLHMDVLRLLREQHVLVVPSLSEGFGLVILEAMAQGVPVVATSNTGGADVIDDDVDGYIVAPRSPEAIAERLLRLMTDEDRRFSMALAAKQKARILSWTAYETRMTTFIREYLRA